MSGDFDPRYIEIAREIFMGAGLGWLSSQFMAMMGNSVLYLIGGSLLLLRIESQERLVERFWNKFIRQANVLGESIGDERFLDRLKIFVRENTYFATGISIGFLIGISK